MSFPSKIGCSLTVTEEKKMILLVNDSSSMTRKAENKDRLNTRTYKKKYFEDVNGYK